MLDVPMNELELGLLTRFLEKPQETPQHVADCLKRVKARLMGNRRAVKQLDKVIPLFDKHEFWDTQPV